MNDIKTSVIIPVYNAEEYLQECMESVLRQTQKEMEIILVDDGSTDGSTRLIEAYEKKYPFVKAVYQENKKLGAARNAGIEAAAGRYIYFLDADDYIEDILFEQCFRAAEKDNLDFVMFDAVSFADGDGETARMLASRETYDRDRIGIGDRVYSGEEYWTRYFPAGGVYSNACLVYINAEFLRKNRLFFEPGIYYEDNDWILRMFLCAGRTAYLPCRFHHRRCHADSIMASEYGDIHFKSIITVFRKVMRMFLEEKEEGKREMVLSMAEAVESRFRDIFLFYRRENRLESFLPEAGEICRYVCEVYPRISSSYKRIRFIDTAIMVKNELDVPGLPAGKPEADPEMERNRILSREFGRYPLNKKGSRVGIYGTGLMCDKFLSACRRYTGETRADLFFFDTYREGTGSYQGYPLYNIKEIGRIRPDCIVIASTRYQEQMLEKIKAFSAGETEVLLLPDILCYCV